MRWRCRWGRPAGRCSRSRAAGPATAKVAVLVRCGPEETVRAWPPRRRRSLLLLFLGELLGELLFLAADLAGRVARGEVVGLVELAHLDLAVLEGDAAHPVEDLGLGLHLHEPEAGDQLLGLGERAIDDRSLVALELDTGAV